jgi:hypothetical protein
LTKTEPGAALAHPVGLALGLDALLGQPPQRLVEVVDGDGDVAVSAAKLVAAPIVVEGQLELLLLAGNAKEVVGCLQLAVANDRKLAAEFEAERLVGAPAAFGVDNAVHGV